MAFSKFFADVRHLDKIDWSVMPLIWWNDTPADPDRKRKRQAEFLVRRFVPVECFTSIGVCSPTAMAATHDAFRELEDSPAVSVRPGWYY
jgi:hypothetical protein